MTVRDLLQALLEKVLKEDLDNLVLFAHHGMGNESPTWRPAEYADIALTDRGNVKG